MLTSFMGGLTMDSDGIWGSIFENMRDSEVISKKLRDLGGILLCSAKFMRFPLARNASESHIYPSDQQTVVSMN